MSWRVALASGLLVMLASVTPADAATPSPTPVPTPPPTPLCAAAADLTKEAKPQQTLDLVKGARADDEVPDDACAIEYTAATQAKAGAAALLRQANAASAVAADDSAWDDIRAKIAAAKKLDAEVTTPSELTALVKKHPAKEPVNLSRSWLEKMTKSWGDFVDGYLAPLGKYLLAATGAIALIVVVARLLLLLPLSNRLPRWPRPARALINVGTFVLLAASGLALAKFLPAAISTTEIDWSSVSLLAGLAGLAAAFTAYSLATRLRISITVAGKADDPGATEIVALLRELGAEAPQGVEVPRGADVDILNGKAIADAPTGILAALLKVLQAVVGFMPWVVVVDDRDGETFVIVTRNGRSWDSAVIHKHPFGKDGPAVEGRKMAAAFILLALSRGYASSDFKGLAGTTHWRALGWQYVATTDKNLDGDARRWLLNKAIDEDPDSALAQLAFHHDLHRTAETAAPIVAYRKWLTDYPNKGRLPASMQLRFGYNQLVAAVNAHAARLFEQAGVDTAPANEIVRTAADALDKLLTEHKKEPLQAHMREVATPLLRYGDVRVAAKEPVVTSPTRTYNKICCDAVTDGPSAKLVERLKENLQIPGDVDWAWHDPMLKRVAEMPEFREAFSKAPPKMTESQPFSPHANALKKASLETPTAILEPATSLTQLAALLDVSPAVAGRLQRAARLASAVSEDLTAHQFLIVEALFGAHVFSAQGIKESPLTPDELTDIVLASATKRHYVPPDREELPRWFQHIKNVV